MKWKLYFEVVLRIIILFSLAMLFTFIPDHLRDFFGDRRRISTDIGDWGMDVEWIWGGRHYWYYWMCVLLFILTLINFVGGIIHSINKHYPKLFL